MTNETPSSTSISPSQPAESITPRKVRIVVNPAGTSAQKVPLLTIFNDVFRPQGIEWEISVTQEAGDARRFAIEAAENGVDVVAACGGDGTVMEVAEGLIGTGIPMAILPGGTANVMSLELNIPGDLALAAALIAEGKNTIRTIDMGQVNDRRFLLRAATGAEALMTLQTPREAKTRWGNLAYVINGISTFNNPVPMVYFLEMDGLKVQVDGISCMIANSGNVGMPGITIAPGIVINDGLLDVIVIRSGDLPSLAAVATAMLLNREQPPEPLLHWQAKEVRVTTQPEQPAISDGEDIGFTPLVARILPQAVRVVCPGEG